MFYWIYSLPTWLMLLAFVGAFCAFALLGLWPGRIFARKVFSGEGSWKNSVQILLESSVAFYSLLIALIAVATYQNYSDTAGKVFHESAALGALYRDVSSYPEPERTELRDELRAYTSYVVHRAWPQQRSGIVPEEGVERTSNFQKLLYEIEPKSEGEKILHAATIEQFNEFSDARRDRLLSVTVSLPPLLWMVLVLGMLVSIMLTWLLPVQRIGPHLVLSGTYAVVSSLMLCLVAAMDNPYRGSFSVSPQAFVILLETLMAPP